MFRKWLVGYEWGKVSVWVSCSESADEHDVDPPPIEITRCSELFREAQQSRIRLGAEKTLALSELESRGLFSVANEQIAIGIAEVESNRLKD